MSISGTPRTETSVAGTGGCSRITLQLCSRLLPFVYRRTATERVSGIGRRPPIDSDGAGGSGRMFLASGNGTFGTANTPTAELGESIVEFNLANGVLTPSDIFVAFNAQTLNGHGCRSRFGRSADGARPAGNLSARTGPGWQRGPDRGAEPRRSGRLRGRECRVQYECPAGHLGGFGIPAGAPTTKPPGLWNTPAYWNGQRLFMGQRAVAHDVFDEQRRVEHYTHSQATTVTSHFPTPSFSISANGGRMGSPGRFETTS